MANPNAAHEPSMEEILASIRQIISEDGGSSAPRIDGIRAEPSAPAPQQRKPEAPSYPSFDERRAEAGTNGAVPAPAPADMQPEPEPQRDVYMPHPDERTAEDEAGGYVTARAARTFHAPPGTHEPEPLLSAESGSAVSGAFGALAHTLLAQNARTLEDVVTEMLQPMLKQWLDENLPAIVERKVQEEIERVSRGRR